MNRSISVIRRRSNYIDLLTPIVAGVTTYRLKWASNFDGVFSPFLDCTNVGLRDDTINPYAVEMQPVPGSVRIVFDPSTYSIPEGVHIWLMLFQVVGAAPETQASAPTLVLPETAHHGVGIVTIHGSAPFPGPQQLDLPRLQQDIRIINHDGGANSLFVSMEEYGPEYECKPSALPSNLTLYGTQGSVYVRGGGAPVVFSMMSTLAFPR